MKEKKKLSLAAQIFIAMVLAIVFGLAMQSCAEFANNFIKPFGTIFLNLVKFIVVPIVLFSIMCGIISMSDIRKIGSIGLKTVIYYLCTTAFAVTIGLVGFICLIVWAVSSSPEKRSRKNWAIAQFILTLVILVLTVVLIAVYGAAIMDLMRM